MRLVRPHAQALQMPALLAARHLAIALGERIDRGRDHEASGRQRRGKLRGGKDRGIVLVDERPEGVPELRLRGREIPVIPPQPAPGRGAPFHEQQGGRIVDDHEIGVERESLRVAGARGMQAGQHRLRHHLLDARQSLAHRRDDGVEVDAAEHDLPGRLDAQVVQDRYDPVQDLGAGAAIAGRADLDDAAPPQPFRDAEHEVHRATRSHRAVVIQLPAHPVHAPPSSSSARLSAMRCRSRTRSSVPAYGSIWLRRSASSWRPRAVSTHSAKSPRPRPSR